MHGALRFEVFVEMNTRHAERIGDGVAQLFIERRLVIQTRSKSETEVAFPSRNPFDGGAGGWKHFVVPTPPLESSADGQDPLAGRRVPFMFVLDKCLQACGGHSRLAAQGIEQFHRMTVIGHGVSCRVAPFPFADIVAYQFGLSADSPGEAVLSARPSAMMRQGDDTRLQYVPRVLMVYTRS